MNIQYCKSNKYKGLTWYISDDFSYKLYKNMKGFISVRLLLLLWDRRSKGEERKVKDGGELKFCHPKAGFNSHKLDD